MLRPWTSLRAAPLALVAALWAASRKAGACGRRRRPDFHHLV